MIQVTNSEMFWIQIRRHRTAAWLLLFLLTAFGTRPAEALGLSPELAAAAARGDTAICGLNPRLVVFHVNNREDYVYQRRNFWQWLKFVPEDYSDYCKITFRKDKILGIGAMAASTMLLVAYDQPIIDYSKHLGRLWGLKPTETQHSYLRPSIKINGQVQKLYLNFPSDANTALYFLGDGIVHLGTAAGFGVYGLAASDDRAKQTCVQLAEAIGCTGLVVQVLKHSTSRETPAKATAPGGVWRPGTSLARYGKNVPKFDAYPTGHLATAMATVTVIADNYPEWKLARPIGYTLMALCGYAMMNNGVHWASDYPLGISIGYTFAKIASARGRTVKSDLSNSPDNHAGGLLKSAQVSPMFSDGVFGATMSWEF
jgi:hypothetical protein